MSFANPLPWWAVLLVVAAAAALAWHAYRRFSAWPTRRYTLSALRFITLLALVIVLMRPIARSSEADSRDVVVPILIDVSRSMAIEDASGASRIERAGDFLAKRLLPALNGRFQVEVLSFGETLVPADAAELAATARRSDLGGALAAARERFRGRPVAGMVILTDGADTSGAVELPVPENTLPPVHAFGFGSEDAGGDREILSVTAAEAVLDGSRVDLAVSAVAHGSAQDAVELRLLENGRPREVRHVRPGPGGGTIREVFHVAPTAGAATVYTVEIPPLPRELVPENNSRSVLVQPPARTRRVLLLEGAPGFEHSFLKRALMSDRSLEVDSVVRKGENEEGADTFYIQASRTRSAALTSGFPPGPVSLFTYDALVLANVAGDQLTGAQLEAARDFVSRRGGGLLVMGAQSFLGRGLVGTPIEDALPMLLNRRSDTAVPAGAARGAGVALTEAGIDHPITRIADTPEENRKRWEGLPALASASALGSARPGAAILATTTIGGAARPLVAVQRFGEGRSMVFAGEASWRWRMMLPSVDHSYETFWRQAIRWLALGASDPIAVYPPVASAVGDDVVIRAAVRDPAFTPMPDASVEVRVSGPDGRRQELSASLEGKDGSAGAMFAAKFTPAQPGLYRVNVTARRGRADAGSASSALLVGGADVEMSDPRLNTALLQRISAGTGGRLMQPGEVEPLMSALRAATPAAALTVRHDLWHNAWSFLVVIALLTAEWLLRRRWGLR
jgi:uncharacterized membrane protein